MKVSIFFLAVFCLYFTESALGQATAALDIAGATSFCETAVPQYCVSSTCPLYCNTLRSRRQRNLCNPGCTTSTRCQLRPMAGGDDPLNRILDAQNREQLIACIAEKRDPSGSVSGRRMTSWQQLRSPSFKKATRM